MLTRQIACWICVLIGAVSAIAADPLQVEVTSAQLKQIRQLVDLSGKDSATFTVAQRLDHERVERSILKLDLGAGGKAVIDERKGTVFAFTAPDFNPPQHLEPEDIIDANMAFAKVTPVLELYSLSLSPQDYEVVYANAGMSVWQVTTKKVVATDQKPSHLTALLEGNTGHLLLLRYLPPLEQPSTEARISQERAKEIAREWLLNDSDFKLSTPSLNAAEVTEDLVRGREGMSFEDMVLTEESHVCWGIPFTVADSRVGKTEYRVWIDKGNGEVVDVTDIDWVNR